MDLSKILPVISKEEEEAHRGERYIALDGKILAYGKDHDEAFKKAQKVVPDLREKKFLMARIPPKIFCGTLFLTSTENQA